MSGTLVLRRFWLVCGRAFRQRTTPNGSAYMACCGHGPKDAAEPTTSGLGLKQAGGGRRGGGAGVTTRTRPGTRWDGDG